MGEGTFLVLSRTERGWRSGRQGERNGALTVGFANVIVLPCQVDRRVILGVQFLRGEFSANSVSNRVTVPLAAGGSGRFPWPGIALRGGSSWGGRPPDSGSTTHAEGVEAIQVKP